MQSSRHNNSSLCVYYVSCIWVCFKWMSSQADFMEQNLCEAYSSSARQEIPSTVWNPEFHYQVRLSSQQPNTCPRLEPNQSSSRHLILFHIIPILILSSPLCLELLSSLSPWVFLLKPWMYWLTNFALLDFITWTVSSEQYKSWISSSCIFPPVPLLDPSEA